MSVPTTVANAEMAEQLLQRKRELEEKAVSLLNHAHEISNQVAQVTGTNLAEQPLQEIDFEAEDERQATLDEELDTKELKYIDFEKEDTKESQSSQKEDRPANMSAEITNLVKQMGVTEQEINEKSHFLKNIDLKAIEVKQKLESGESLAGTLNGVASSMGGKIPKKFKQALREIEKSTLGKDYGTRLPTEEEDAEIQKQFQKVIVSSGHTNVMKNNGTRVSRTTGTKERLLEKLRLKKEAAASATPAPASQNVVQTNPVQKNEKKKKRKNKNKNKKQDVNPPHQ